jgi:tetratricopeptide (TPR) repeat protein
VQNAEMTKAVSHRWNFKQHIRAKAFGWRGSRLAIRRLNEASAEIRSMARQEPTEAAEGAVSLAERIWPAFEHIDTSSGALGAAVNRTLETLIPIIANAPADRPARNRWLDRLWLAVLEDGVNYLSPIEEAWGDLCASREVASRWADQILPVLRTAWSDPRPGNYVRGTDVCLASLLAAGRNDELLEVLSLKPHPIWPWRRYGIRALVAEGRLDDALIYAEASRGLNIPDAAVNAECEVILIAAGRREAAYRQYGLTANETGTGLATFRQVVKKYPEIDPKQILADLADASGDTGKWFAAAKDAGHLDLALRFATTGRTNPRTLSRASRDFLKSEPLFSFRVGRLAVERILAGHGFDITALDLGVAVDHFLAAADQLGAAADAHQDLGQMLAANPNAPSYFRTPILKRVGAKSCLS